MLGYELVRNLLLRDDFEVYGMGRRPCALLASSHNVLLDFETDFDVRDTGLNPDVIIHTAGITDLNYCERNPAAAYQVHEHASGKLATMGHQRTLFIYISTDSVFDGETGMYKETDQPRPLNVYADSKLQGEKAVLKESAGKAVIVRTNIYGLHFPMRSSLAEWAYREWHAGHAISGYSDFIFNAVMTKQLSDILQLIIDGGDYPQILNVGSSAAISKFEFLDQLREKLGVSRELLQKTESVSNPGQLRRPKNTSLNTGLLSHFCKVPDFGAGIDRWIDNLVR